ncbi:hypothetical protein CIT292_07678 [Citrobacter youngae ATCC 29220]|uniref:Uncharacterized protein n=1 Tax=Citrobacter youngae ATCC 29220 TaxID=500640 RepID=D4BB31_9ENTR|nr:hypothetical protein CIT292_07678 [Citrobacter youngae ATCC 29220]
MLREHLYIIAQGVLVDVYILEWSFYDLNRDALLFSDGPPSRPRTPFQVVALPDELMADEFLIYNGDRLSYIFGCNE